MKAKLPVVLAVAAVVGFIAWALRPKPTVPLAQTMRWESYMWVFPSASTVPTTSAQPPHPMAPNGAWNDRPGPRTAVELALQDSGAWLVIRSGPGLPGWWYGKGVPKGECITGSLFTRTDASGMFLCGAHGWRHVETTTIGD